MRPGSQFASVRAVENDASCDRRKDPSRLASVRAVESDARCDSGGVSRSTPTPSHSGAASEAGAEGVRMRAVRFEQYGDVDVLQVVEVPTPEPAAE